MKKVIGLIACVFVLAAAIVTVADYTPVSAENSGGTALSVANVTTSGVKVDTPTALSVTNGQAITVAAGTYILSGVGGANDSTNTVTIAAGTIGTKVTLLVDAASTNLVTIADAATMQLAGGAAWLGDNSDSLQLVAITAANWVETSRSNN